MGKWILLISVISLLLIPTASFGETPGNAVIPSGYWPANTMDCASFAQVDNCQYLLCLCYSGCNVEGWGIDFNKKQMCDNQFLRCQNP